MKDFNEFLASFNIQDSRRYTMREVAAMCSVTTETVQKWRLQGLRNRTHGIFTLETFLVGGCNFALGVHLKRFLAMKNGMSHQDI